LSGTNLGHLLENIILLLGLALLHSAFPLWPRPGRRGLEILSGVLVGCIALVVMLRPLRFAPGVIFDTRSVLLSVAGLFFGVVPTAIATAMAVILRLYQGGVAAWAGAGVAVISACLGILWRSVRGRWFTSFRAMELYVFGLVVSVAMLLMMLTLPWDTALSVIRNISAPVLIIYPIGTVLMGRFMAVQQTRRRDQDVLKTVTETSPVGIVMVGDDGVFTYANTEAERVLGLSRDEITRRTYNAPEWRVTDVEGGPFPEEDIPFNRVMGTARPVFDVRHAIEWPNGQRVLLSINAAPLLDEAGRPISVVVTLQDITERAKSDERVEHLNRVLRATRSISHLAINERDAQALIQGTCDLLVEHRGYDAVSVFLVNSGGVITQFAHAGPDPAGERLKEMLAVGVMPSCCVEAVRHGGSAVVLRALDTCAECPAGGDRTSGETVSAELRHAGTAYGCLSASTTRNIGIDSDERELFEAMAADVAFALHGASQARDIVEAREERVRMEADLRQAQKMEAVGRLAGGVAHDFNNMLSVILGNVDLALDGLHPNDPAVDELRQIEDAARRSADLTRQLLAFSRRQTVSPQVVDLNETIENEVRLLIRLIGENIEVAFSPAADLWRVWIDPAQVDQVLANLAVNARDSIAVTGSVTVRTRNRIVGEVEAFAGADKAPGDYVELSFEDTGKGMDRETLDRIFEPFFTTKASGEGTGLGLSTVYGIVRQNEGFIEVESQPGGGATFRLSFPRCLLEAHDGPVQPAERSTTGTETILVVEDEESVLRLTKAILERAGYAVLTAQSPAEAVSCAAEYSGQLHLLVTDVIMPGMNGVDLRDRIVAMRPDIKILFMSGYSEDVIAQRGVVEGGIHFMEKPFSALGLAQKVRSVLDS